MLLTEEAVVQAWFISAFQRKLSSRKTLKYLKQDFQGIMPTTQVKEGNNL